MRLRLVSLVLGLAAAASAGAAPIFRVADLNPARLPGKVLPDICFGVFGDSLFFGGYDRANGVELWRTDGTPEGIAFVADLDPAGDSSPCGFIAFQGALYFSAYVGGRPTLWRTDGTSPGTTPVESFAYGSALTDLVATESLLFFAADDGVHGKELWRSDGTAPGTAMVADLNPGSTEAYLDQLTALGDRVFFRVFSSDTGRFHLEQSDGTEGGTTFLHDMGTGYYSIVGRAGDLVYFSSLAVGSAEVWRTDGSSLGTIQLLHFLPGALFFPPNEVLIGPSDLVDLSGVAVFVGRDDVHGWQPWRSDGTVAGTRRIADVEPLEELPGIGGFVESGGLVYFHANGLHELWRTDGTAAGTFRIREFSAIASQYPMWSGGGLLFLQAYDDAHGMEPWRSDGTAAGTFLLADIEPGPAPSQSTPFLEFGLDVFFGASRDQSRLLWKTDGTPQGTVLADGGTHGQSALPLSLTDAGAELFFATQDAEFGSANILWSSDGTSDGTRQRGAFCAIFAATLTPFHGDAYFYAYDCELPGFQLWNTHGSVGPAPLNGHPTAAELAVVGDTLFFVVNTQLWKTDGTENGTVFVESLAGPPFNLTAVSGRLLFFVGNEGLGTVLWRSDGTSAGTSVVRDLGPGSSVAGPRPVTFGSRIVFPALDQSGPGLWFSDGTEAGTVTIRVRHIGPADGLATAGRFVYFGDADTGSLWRTDGTSEGTVRLADVAASHLTGARGQLFFAADDGIHGSELWTSTGYPETTRIVRDIFAGSFGSTPRYLADAGGMLMFAASDGVHGVEPWQSDGTAEGTAMVAEVAPGPSSSSPFGFERSGDLVFFSANDGDTGFELWAVPAPELGIPDSPARPTPRVLPPRP